MWSLDIRSHNLSYDRHAAAMPTISQAPGSLTCIPSTGSLRAPYVTPFVATMDPQQQYQPCSASRPYYETPRALVRAGASASNLSSPVQQPSYDHWEGPRNMTYIHDSGSDTPPFTMSSGAFIPIRALSHTAKSQTPHTTLASRQYAASTTSHPNLADPTLFGYDVISNQSSHDNHVSSNTVKNQDPESLPQSLSKRQHQKEQKRMNTLKATTKPRRPPRRQPKQAKRGLYSAERGPLQSQRPSSARDWDFLESTAPFTQPGVGLFDLDTAETGTQFICEGLEEYGPLPGVLQHPSILDEFTKTSTPSLATCEMSWQQYSNGIFSDD